MMKLDKKFDYTQYIHIFKKYGFAEDSFWNIVKMYRQAHRHYHTEDHLQDVLTQISRSFEIRSSRKENILIKELLVIVALFHDCVYDIKDPLHNERASVDMFRRYSACLDPNADTKLTEKSRSKICTVIIDTMHRTPPKHKNVNLHSMSNIFWKIDNSVLERDMTGLLKWEKQIFKEYQAYPLSLYKQARLEFLDKEILSRYKTKKKNTNVHNLVALAKYVNFFEPTIGVYPGSFSPFHIGHLNILYKAEKLFDKVILLKGMNPEKQEGILSIQNSDTARNHFPECVQNREITAWSGMTHIFLQKIEKSGGKPILIRGLRNGKDLDYEVNQLRFSETFYPEIKVAYIQCDKQYEHISSSAIRNISQIDSQLAKQYLP